MVNLIAIVVTAAVFIHYFITKDIIIIAFLVSISAGRELYKLLKKMPKKSKRSWTSSVLIPGTILTLAIIVLNGLSQAILVGVGIGYCVGIVEGMARRV